MSSVAPLPPEPDYFEPDDFFKADFADGELSKRLWSGSLRIAHQGHTLICNVLLLKKALCPALHFRFSHGRATLMSFVNDVDEAWNDLNRLTRSRCPFVFDDGTNENHLDKVEHEVKYAESKHAYASFVHSPNRQLCDHDLSQAR